MREKTHLAKILPAPFSQNKLYRLHNGGLLLNLWTNSYRELSKRGIKEFHSSVQEKPANNGIPGIVFLWGYLLVVKGHFSFKLTTDLRRLWLYILFFQKMLGNSLIIKAGFWSILFVELRRMHHIYGGSKFNFPKSITVIILSMVFE